MNIEITSSMSTIRDTWSDQERRQRKEVASLMQLQLRALVVLAQLSQVRDEQQQNTLPVASAC